MEATYLVVLIVAFLGIAGASLFVVLKLLRRSAVTPARHHRPAHRRAAHDALLALLPLVGVWAGPGAAGRRRPAPSSRIGQQATFAHDGRPFLAYESRSWLHRRGRRRHPPGVARNRFLAAGCRTRRHRDDDSPRSPAWPRFSPAQPATSVGNSPRSPCRPRRPRSTSAASAGSMPCPTGHLSTPPSWRYPARTSRRI